MVNINLAYGQVKTWGCNPLGLGYAINNSHDGLPQMIPTLRNTKIIQIAASGDISNDKNAASFALGG
jgi:hypothetical protein